MQTDPSWCVTFLFFKKIVFHVQSPLKTVQSQAASVFILPFFILTLLHIGQFYFTNIYTCYDELFVDFKLIQSPL
jgi:hypothetical protein